jgi:hypothetical protein
VKYLQLKQKPINPIEQAESAKDSPLNMSVKMERRRRMLIKLMEVKVVTS